MPEIEEFISDRSYLFAWNLGKIIRIQCKYGIQSFLICSDLSQKYLPNDLVESALLLLDFLSQQTFKSMEILLDSIVALIDRIDMMIF